MYKGIQTVSSYYFTFHFFLLTRPNVKQFEYTRKKYDFKLYSHLELDSLFQDLMKVIMIRTRKKRERIKRREKNRISRRSAENSV